MRFAIHRSALALLVSLGACLALAQSPLPPASKPAAAIRLAPAAGDVQGLSAELLYRILLGEVALQRGEPALAARAFLDAARDTRDPRLARRATEVAVGARQRGLAEQAARLWSDLDPQADRPKQVLAALASGSTRDLPEEGESDLRAKLERFLADAALSGAGVGEPFLQLNRLFAQQSDKETVFRLIRELAQPYPTTPEAQFAVALAGYNAGMANPATGKVALEAVERALVLKPNWERAALLKAEIVGKASPKQAIAWLSAFTKTSPDSRAARAALAQYLVDDKRYADARAIYQKLWEEAPDERQFQFGMAVISMQMKDWAGAEQHLLELKRAGWGESGVVETYLAQVAEETRRYDEAIVRYGNVPEGDRAWLAKLRIALLLGKQGKLEEAKRYLADLPAVTIDQRVQVRQAEAQLLREAGDLPGSYAVLARGLAEHPDAPDLIYDHAMVAEKLDKVDEAEKALRRLLELRPEDPTALNALGYTLVDRTRRIDEGFVLIQKAHGLAPSDPFIMDSMGWALYRLGRLDEAASYLRRALEERPDPEIAAHLGEVLWAKGEPDRAREVWQFQLKLTPDNALLLETVRRHGR